MAFDQLPAPTHPKLPKNAAERDSFQMLYVILDQASLEIIPLGRDRNRGNHNSHDPVRRSHKVSRFVLLNGDDHVTFLKRHGRDPASVRPDITHQCLMALLDSPLNKSGHLQVFIRTCKGIVIRVSPLCRIPRTFKRFAGLMAQVLHKLHVRSEASSERLLEVVKSNDLIEGKLLPIRHLKLAMSTDGPLVNLRECVKGMLSTEQVDDRPSSSPLSLVVWIGAMSHGEDRFDKVPDEARVSISSYALSASVVCGKLCDAVEDAWQIL